MQFSQNKKAYGYSKKQKGFYLYCYTNKNPVSGERFYREKRNIREAEKINS